MVDFELTDADRDILARARAEAEMGRGYARFFDQNEDRHEPPTDVDFGGHPSPRAMLAQRLDETSGLNVLDALISIEEQWGDVLMRDSELGIGSIILNSGGSPEMRERWRGKVLAISMTEPGAGSDPAQMQMTVAQDKATGEWVLNGEKIYISSGDGCAGVVVMAKVVEDDVKVAMGTFLVPKGTPGFVVLPQVRKMGSRAWDTVDYYFEDCRVPADHRLYADFRQAMTAFNNTRPLMAAKGLGVARATLDFTRETLLELGADLDDEAPIARRSAVADRLLRLEALYDASLLTVMRSKWLEDTAGGSKIEASMAKAHGGLAVRRITQECIEILGQAAASEAHLIEKWFRDARVFDIFEGPGEIQRLIIARALLGYGPRELS